MNLLDPVGAFLSLICTYYFTTNNRSAWVIGAFASLINFILYCQKGIYGYLILEGVFLLSMAYGWYQVRPIRYLTVKQTISLSMIALIGIFFMAKILKLAGSDVPYWDSVTTTLSLVAQFLLCLKYIHCWIVWFIADAFCALLQLYKGLPFHSALYWMYLILAVIGYYRWRKMLVLPAT